MVIWVLIFVFDDCMRQWYNTKNNAEHGGYINEEYFI
jgi:hypothetical protein